MNRVLLGLGLCFLALLLGSLFFIEGYHKVYWSHPVVFVLITLIGVFAPLAGGVLLGAALVGTGGSAGTLQRFSFGAGVTLTLIGVLLGVSAIGMALGVANTGYWHNPPLEYEGDYAMLGFQINLFRLAIPTEMIGSLLLGAGLQMKKAG
jgi:hypothetical protein